MTHGDLVPGNVLVADGRLAGVIDVGGLGPADPALDLVGAWHLLETGSREVLREDLGCDDREWERGKAWAFAQAMGLVWYYATAIPPCRSPVAALLTDSSKRKGYANLLTASDTADASWPLLHPVNPQGRHMAIRSGKNYERQVMRHLMQRRPQIAFELNAKVLDTTGQYERQIDVWLPDKREIVECKHHTRPVDIGVVDRLAGTIQDVNAESGHIFSSSGFTERAKRRAQKTGINCTQLSYATEFETFLRPSGSGYYLGGYIELCICSTRPYPAGNIWARISYFSEDGDFDTLSAALSVNWCDVTACRFIAYLLLAHVLRRPPSDLAIDEFMDSYGDRFKIGQEWIVSLDEAWCFARPELL